MIGPGCRAAILVSAVLIALPGGASAAVGTLTGKVSFRDKPVASALVRLFADWKGGFDGRPDIQAPTLADGSFSVAVPAGRYFVVVRKTAGSGNAPLAPGDLFAFYGGNPVTVAAGEKLAIGVNLGTVIGAEQATVPGGTGLKGKVYLDGAPLDRARVTLFQDGETNFRGLGYASAFTTADGSFSFNLAPGTYWVVARKRSGDDRMGPLAAGDLFAFAHANPVEVREGMVTAVPLNATAKQVRLKDSGQEITPAGTSRGGETVVKGVVKDALGKPVGGIRVGAYRDPALTAKPDFISNLTGEDGSYTLALGGEGEYFIVARNTLGGPVGRGDLFGRYAGNESRSIVIKEGEKVSGIDIVVTVVE